MQALIPRPIRTLASVLIDSAFQLKHAQFIILGLVVPWPLSLIVQTITCQNFVCHVLDIVACRDEKYCFEVSVLELHDVVCTEERDPPMRNHVSQHIEDLLSLIRFGLGLE